MKDRRYLILGAAIVAACLVLLGTLKLLQERPLPSDAPGDKPVDYLRTLHDRLAGGKPWRAAGGREISAESAYFRDDGLLILDSVDSERGVVITSPGIAFDDFEAETSVRKDGTFVIDYRPSGSPTTGPGPPSRLAARQVHIWIADGQLSMRLLDVEMTSGGTTTRVEEQVVRIPLGPEGSVAASHVRTKSDPGGSPAAGGCQEGKKGAAAPKQAFVNLLEAVRTGNKDLFWANVQAEDKEFAEAMFEGMSAFNDLFVRMEEVYGPDAMKPRPGWSYQRMPNPRKAAERIEVEIDGDTAAAEVADDPATVAYDRLAMPLVRKNGRWFVDWDELVSLSTVLEGMPEEGRTQMRQFLAEFREAVIKGRKLTAAACRDAREKIGKKGYTVERIVAEMKPAGTKDGGDGNLKVWVDGQLVTPKLPPRAAGPRGARERPARTPAPPKIASVPRRSTPAAKTYTVRAGDTLIGIAKRVYGPEQGHRYRQIFQANRDKLSSPDKLPVGLTLRLPPM